MSRDDKKPTIDPDELENQFIKDVYAAWKRHDGSYETLIGRQRTYFRETVGILDLGVRERGEAFYEKAMVEGPDFYFGTSAQNANATAPKSNRWSPVSFAGVALLCLLITASIISAFIS